MTVNEKIDFLYSKFVQPNSSQTSVFNSQIWTNGNDIPALLPMFDENGEYKNSSGAIILKRVEHAKMELISTSPDAFSSSNVQDVVSYENGFDSTYEYKFYNRSSDGTYVQIPLGQGDYFFDHDSGVLFFPNGRNLLYNPNRLYVTFIKYVGTKGVDASSQFPGSSQLGPAGETGPTGDVGPTGPVSDYAFRYKSTWSSSTTYSKWDIVKRNGKFFFSTEDNNVAIDPSIPTGNSPWQPFGIPQLSSGFDYPETNTYWVSPSFTNTGKRFNTLEAAFADLLLGSNPLTDATIMVYPGNYVINNNVLIKNNVNVNVIFNGKVNVTFRDDSLSMILTLNNRVEFRGSDYAFTNGNIYCVNSSLSTFGGVLPNVNVSTLDSSDTGRLLFVSTEVKAIDCKSSFVNLIGCNVVEGITMDDLSAVHLESCMIQARPTADPDQFKIDIVSSISPPGFGYENPALFIKNSRILSNAEVLRSNISPSYGFQIGIISSALYVKDSSTSFLDFTDPVDAFVLGSVVNTTYDTTKLRILNLDGGFQTIAANFED